MSGVGKGPIREIASGRTQTNGNRCGLIDWIEVISKPLTLYGLNAMALFVMEGFEALDEACPLIVTLARQGGG